MSGAGIAPALVAVDQDKVVLEVRRQAAELLAAAKAFVVRPATREEASRVLIQVATLRKRAEERRKAIVKPHNDYAKTVGKIVTDALEPIVEAERVMRQKIGDFIAQEEADAIAARAEARARELSSGALVKEAEKAEAAGDITARDALLEEAVEAETSAGQLATFGALPVETKVRTEVGVVAATMVWTFTLLDIGQVPEDYLKPRELDTKKVREAVAAGLRDADEQHPAIAGIRIHQEQRMRVTA